ncbi:MAG: hypothetical protein WD267_11470 [Balneolales bacterium]
MTEIKGVQKLYEAKQTNLPTNQTAHYYGRADGNVYVIYGTEYHTQTGKGKTKYIFARLNHCSYNFKGEVFKNNELLERELAGYRELDDQDTYKNLEVIETRKVSKELFPQIEQDFFKS